MSRFDLIMYVVVPCLFYSYQDTRRAAHNGTKRTREKKEKRIWIDPGAALSISGEKSAAEAFPNTISDSADSTFEHELSALRR